MALGPISFHAQPARARPSSDVPISAAKKNEETPEYAANADALTVSADVSSIVARLDGPDALDDEPDGSASRYQAQATLGAGGSAEVIAAYDRVMRRMVALKLARGAGSATRVLAEARVTAALEHPNIVPVYDSGRTPDGAFAASRQSSAFRKLISEGTVFL